MVACYSILVLHLVFKCHAETINHLFKLSCTDNINEKLKLYVQTPILHGIRQHHIFSFPLILALPI